MANITNADYNPYVGKTAYLKTGLAVGSKAKQITIMVKIIKGKFAWGRHQFLVEPMAGEGQAWVYASRVSLTRPPASEEDDG